MDISSWIHHHARQRPEKTALSFEDRQITFAEFENKIARLAAAMVYQLDIKHGDRFSYLGENSVDMLELFFACARIGAIFVPLNARMTVIQHRYFIESSQPKGMLVEAEFWQHAIDVLDGSKTRKFGFGQSISASHRLDSLFQAEQKLAPNSNLDDQTPVMIAYTSGSTGNPKGAVLTHRTIHYGSINAIHMGDMTAQDHILTNLPMFHVGGLTVQTLPALYIGASVTIHRQFDAGMTLKEIETSRISVYLALPKITRALTHHKNWLQTDLSSMRVAQTGSTLVPKSVLTPWFDRGIPAQQIYGLTEALPPVIGLALEDSESRAGTMGKAALYCDVRIVDSSMKDVVQGERGEILLKGPCVFSCYWNNQEATEDAFNDGWFRTGDIAHCDDEGFITMDDRLKNVIIVGSSNVYPADLEHILSESGEITEAAVIGRQHPELGEVPVAFVQLKKPHSMDDKSVINLLKGRLASYQLPQEVVFIESFPRTSLGKIHKPALESQLAINSDAA